MLGCWDVGHQEGITCRWQPRKGVMTTGDDEQLGHTNEHNNFGRAHQKVTFVLAVFSVSKEPVLK